MGFARGSEAWWAELLHDVDRMFLAAREVATPAALAPVLHAAREQGADRETLQRIIRNGAPPSSTSAPVPRPRPQTDQSERELLEQLLAAGDTIIDGLQKTFDAVVAVAQRVDQLERDVVKVRES